MLTTHSEGSARCPGWPGAALRDPSRKLLRTAFCTISSPNRLCIFLVHIVQCSVHAYFSWGHWWYLSQMDLCSVHVALQPNNFSLNLTLRSILSNVDAYFITLYVVPFHIMLLCTRCLLNIFTTLSLFDFFSAAQFAPISHTLQDHTSIVNAYCPAAHFQLRYHIVLIRLNLVLCLHFFLTAARQVVRTFIIWLLLSVINISSLLCALLWAPCRFGRSRSNIRETEQNREEVGNQMMGKPWENFGTCLLQ